MQMEKIDKPNNLQKRPAGPTKALWRHIQICRWQQRTHYITTPKTDPLKCQNNSKESWEQLRLLPSSYNLTSVQLGVISRRDDQCEWTTGTQGGMLSVLPLPREVALSDLTSKQAFNLGEMRTMHKRDTAFEETSAPTCEKTRVPTGGHMYTFFMLNHLPLRRVYGLLGT